MTVIEIIPHHIYHPAVVYEIITRGAGIFISQQAQSSML
jgi:hypothetical protein